MIKKDITFTDYDGNQRTETYWFHLNKAELTEWELSVGGGLTNTINKIVAENDNKRIISLFKNIILKSYGEKSIDGKRFVKNQELRDAFEQSEAYSELFMELATNEKAAADFINGVIPKDLSDQIKSGAAVPQIAE